MLQHPIPTARIMTKAFFLGLLGAAAASASGCRAQSAQAAVAPAPQGRVDEARPGDRIYLYVEGERALTDTFTVRPGSVIELPNIGPISLAGVPRSAIESHIASQITKYVKKPVVRAHALMRVGVLGEVVHPGFYAVPPDAAVADALASAGGPTQGAKVDGIRVDRDGRTIAADVTVRRALTAGTSLDQMGLSSGDQFVVPPRKDPDRMLRIIGVIATIPAAILAIMAINR